MKMSTNMIQEISEKDADGDAKAEDADDQKDADAHEETYGTPGDCRCEHEAAKNGRNRGCRCIDRCN